MATEWHRLCKAEDLNVAASHVDVQFADERRHRVTVVEEGDVYLLSAFVVRRAVVADAADLEIQIWRRNRATALVGFRIDHRSRLVGEAWVPPRRD